MNDRLVLKGIPASPGVAEGIARLADEHGRAADFKEGDILVAKVTEPSMVIMMNKASAIVTCLGGITSHAAIVARELGIPCVVSIANAMTDIGEGSTVEVDGNSGTVTVLNWYDKE